MNGKSRCGVCTTDTVVVLTKEVYTNAFMFILIHWKTAFDPERVICEKLLSLVLSQA